MMYGFDDLTAKLNYLSHEHLETVILWTDAIREYGKDSYQAVDLCRQQWRLYREIKILEIESLIQNEKLKARCVSYMLSLDKSYSLEKSKQLLDEFVTIIQTPKNWFAIQIYMKRNPVT